MTREDRIKYTNLAYWITIIVAAVIAGGIGVYAIKWLFTHLYHYFIQ